jgi:adenine-specific DNA-methyltransferase
MKELLEQFLLTNESMLIEGKINKNKVAEMARKYDKELLDLLLSKEEIKTLFFVETESVLVFKLDIFLQFINNKSFLPDSYTKYKQSIGLGTNDGKLLSENREIVLN